MRIRTTTQIITLVLCLGLAFPATAGELHDAADAGDTKEVTRLIKAGVSVNEVDEDGWTSLHFAAEKGHTETTLALIEKGADINAIAKNGWTPLHLAAMRGHIETVNGLIKSGAYPRPTTNSGATPLDFARFGKQWSVVGILERYEQ